MSDDVKLCHLDVIQQTAAAGSPIISSQGEDLEIMPEETPV